MARARSIKPGFFTHEILTELSPLHRILFAGLWCWADRRGILEDRPKFLKTVILPYDDCDVNAMLNDLAAKGFIVGYRVGDQRFIHVAKLRDHQHFHVDEKPNKFPEPTSEGAVITRGITPVQDTSMATPEQHRVGTGPTPEQHRSSTSVICNPESVICNLSFAGSASPPASEPKAKKAKPPKDKPSPDPLHAPVVGMLTNVFEVVTGKKYGFHARDAKAVATILDFSRDIAEIERRWRSGLSAVGWKHTATIHDLSLKWNEHTGASSTGSPNPKKGRIEPGQFNWDAVPEGVVNF